MIKEGSKVRLRSDLFNGVDEVYYIHGVTGNEVTLDDGSKAPLSEVVEVNSFLVFNLLVVLIVTLSLCLLLFILWIVIKVIVYVVCAVAPLYGGFYLAGVLTGGLLGYLIGRR